VALINWAAKTVAAKAVDEWDALAELPFSERLRTLEKAHEVVRNAAGLRGTRVHALAHRLALGEQVDVPDELYGHVQACARFLDEWDVQPILTERPVFSREHLYAGSPDLVGDVRGGNRWLIDWKTNRNGPYGDMAFQLAAYRYAEFYLDDDDIEQPVPEVDEAVVVWLREDGYDVFPFEAGPAQFRTFLYIAEVARAAEECTDYMGEPLIGVGA
jgi:hypothetical protein